MEAAGAPAPSCDHGGVADHDSDTAWARLAEHDSALATVRLFADRSGALRIAVLLDCGAGAEPPLIEAEAGGPMTVMLGEAAYEITPEWLGSTPPRPLDPPRPIPSSAWRFDPDGGEVQAPVGAVASLGLGVLELARVLGGRSVATADFAIADGGEVTIAARVGEPLVLAMGDAQYELPVPYSVRDA